uniref:PEHE domain-containing protein n=1 Tax=Caenorhabditis tropicalis TaxID=1561998 RepID=A0A1I7UWG4_9PELO
MVSKLTKAMGALSQKDDDDCKSPTRSSSIPSATSSERRKSARLNKSSVDVDHQTDDVLDNKDPHDSGTESDEEELQTITSRCGDPLDSLRNYDDYLHMNPPRVSASPAWKRDLDETESWDSFGRESGIMTGDNDSDTDGMATPTPVRRRLRDDDSSPSPGKRGHEDANPMADHPIAWRLRSFNNDRAVKVAARRCPVQVLINRPPIPVAYRFDHVENEVESVELMPPAPAPKRGRRNSHRPSLDFEKMVQTRIEEHPTPSASSSFSKPVTRSQINQ